MYKIQTIFVIVFLLVASVSLAGEMMVKGVYQGMDLYVLNPMLDEDVGDLYCVNQILINDVPYEGLINSSAFCILLSELNFDLGEMLTITLKHSNDCHPRIINPEILKPLSTYELLEMSLEFGDMLQFKTSGESSQLLFYVQQFRWGKWVDIAEVNGNGGPGNQQYSVRVYPHHGENKFRVYQNDHLHRFIISKENKFKVEKDSIVIESKIKKVKSNIKFSGDTYFLIQNEYGEVIKKGFANEIDVAGLEKGKYYLRYDNTWLEFMKK